MLGALGLQVNRLIRVSYGPFQLGELPAGAVMEIRTRALREQMGERLAAIAGADFSGPIVEREEPRADPPRHPEARARSARASTALARSDARPPAQREAPRRATAGRAKTQAASPRPHPSRPGCAGRLRMTGRGRAAVREGRRANTPPVSRQAAALMRIVGGRFRGRTLQAPKSQAIRPTADRLRESLFNILAHAYGDPVTARACSTCSPAPARSGWRRCRAGLRSRCSSTTAPRRARCFAPTSMRSARAARPRSSAATRPSSGRCSPVEPFSLAFLDPPYGKGLAEQALASARDGGWLAPGALVVVEEAADAAFAAPDGFEELERRDYGDTQLIFLRLSPSLCPSAASIHADAGGLDDLAPALDVLLQELGEIGRACAARAAGFPGRALPSSGGCPAARSPSRAPCASCRRSASACPWERRSRSRPSPRRRPGPARRWSARSGMIAARRGAIIAMPFTVPCWPAPRRSGSWCTCSRCGRRSRPAAPGFRRGTAPW